MTRLWDKGTPLDARVLRYTAGEDYALDERLVRYDVRASIAHAEMLHAQQLLTAQDLTLLRDGLNLANGIGWSPDGATIYVNDSVPGTIWAAEPPMKNDGLEGMTTGTVVVVEPVTLLPRNTPEARET